MECLSPIVVATRCKVLSPVFGEVLKREVRCGKCANCQTTFQKEWYYRAFQEYRYTVELGGYMLMDCLTYSDKFVPKLWRFMSDLPEEYNYMCFDYYDFRYFMVRLRDNLKRKGYNVKNTLRYFAASEYGTSENGTHRPHIHILFYVTTPNLDNYTLSKAVSECWHYGRTDGLPYKSHSYVDNYTIYSGMASSQRVCKYVSKYVMKSSEYQKVIDERINKVLSYYYENKFKYYRLGEWCFELDYYYRIPKEVVSWETFESFLRSSTAKKIRSSLLRYMNQFHRQSLGFGAKGLENININTVIDSNLLTLQDSKQIVMRIGLPNYYRRKLFYHLIEVNGMKSWILNDSQEAKQYKRKRDEDKMRQLIDKINLYQYESKDIRFDSVVVSDYVINYRWRDNQKMFDDELNMLQKLDTPVLYNYSTLSDIAKFHGRFITDTFLGVINTNYINNQKKSKKIKLVSFNDYLKIHLIEDVEIEEYLDNIKKRKFPLNESIQKNYENRQRLNQVYKNLLK